MKATVKDIFLNVRRGSPSVNAPVVRVLLPGSMIETDNILFKGDRFEGIDTWLKDDADNFYWSGGLHFSPDVETLLKISQPPTLQRKTFAWFEKLKIENIWNQYDERGELATIAVLDTGYNVSISDVNDAVADSIVVIDAMAYPGVNLVKNDQSRTGHGTRCIALAGSRNLSQYLVGVAPSSRMLSAKVSINREVRNFEFLLNGIAWAIKNGADVISISYAVELKDADVTKFEKKLNEIVQGRNVLIFASAGNAGSTPIHAERYPGSFGGCVSVGATDHAGNLSAITIQSNRTIIHAPGIDIESFGKSPEPDPDSGTSFSTPIIAGVAALAISYLKKQHRSWNPSELLSKIYQSGDPVPGSDSKKSINPVNFFNLLTQL